MPKPEVFGFKSEQTARELLKLIQNQKSQQQAPPRQPAPLQVTGHKAIRIYLCEAKIIITAADKLIPSVIGTGIAYILERSLKSYDHELVHWEPAEGQRTEVRVFNLSQHAYPIGARFLAIQDMDGDLYAFRNQWCRRVKGKVTEALGIEPDSFGEVTIWRNGVATDETIDAHLDWMHNSQALAYDTQVIAEWFEDQDDGNGQWVITNAACS